jgi:PAS domain S-box-containing protein
MKLSIENKLAIGFALAISLMLVFTVSTYKDMNTLTDLGYKQKQVSLIIKSIYETKTAIIKMESSSRGYALQADSLSLKKYYKAVEDVKVKWTYLNTIMHGDSFFENKKRLIEKLISNRIDIATMLVKAKKNYGIDAASVIVATGFGNVFTTQINNEFLQLEIAQSLVLDNNVHVQIKTARKTIAFFAVLFPLLLTIYIFVYILFKRDLSWRRNSRKQIKLLNDNLEKKVEERSIALATSERRYRLLAENSADIVSLIDINTSYLFISDSVVRILGFEPDEMIGKSCLEFIHPEDASFLKVTKDIVLEFSQFRHLKKDGTYVWVESGANYTFDETGNVTGIIVNTRDISERKKAENDLIESKAKMTAVLENSQDAIWSIDKDKKLISFNNSFYERNILLYGVIPYIEMSILDCLDLESSEIWIKAYDKALAGENFIQEFVDNNTHQELFFDVSFNPILVKGEVTGVAVFSSNITARKNLDQQLHYKVKELNTFMYKSTHDLRSPLVSVMGLVQLAKELTTNEELIQYFEMINTSVHKMDNLLVDLVTIANVSQGQLLVNEIDFNKIIDEILLSLGYSTDFSNIIFRRHINIESGFRTDHRLLYSVMQNLIDNAVKYKNVKYSESIIIITIDVNAIHARISITDNGIGIPEEVQDKVFDMFYRATTNSTGTGLGLYIVKTTVEKLGGKVTLNSIEGKGTSMNVILPCL